MDLVEVRNYEPNETVIDAGSPGDSIFLIYGGLVNVNMRHPDKTIYQMKAGDYFGKVVLQGQEGRQT